MFGRAGRYGVRLHGPICPFVTQKNTGTARLYHSQRPLRPIARPPAPRSNVIGETSTSVVLLPIRSKSELLAR